MYSLLQTKVNKNVIVSKLLQVLMTIFRGRVAYWLATCARKPKVSGSTLDARCEGELSAVIAQLMPKCL